MAEGAWGDPRGVVRHEGDSQHLHSRRPGCDRLERRRHSHEVRAQGPGHAHLGRRFIVRPGKLGVDALGKAGVDAPGDLAKPRGVQIGQIDEVRPPQRRRRGEVDVVADEGHGSRAPFGDGRSAPVGQDAHFCARRRGGSDSVGDGVDALALVEVGPRSQHQSAARFERNGSQSASVPCHAVG